MVISITPFVLVDDAAPIPTNGILDRCHSTFKLCVRRLEINKTFES